MKLVVFGATGGTGRQVVEQALEAGHEVTAVVRDPAGLPARHERLRVVKADVLDPAEIEPTFSGADAVVSALGSRSMRAPSSICSAGTGSILEAMEKTDVRRFICVSAAPIADVDKEDPLPYRLVVRPLLWTIFRRVYEDMALMEEAVRRSETEWTILHPPRLTDRPRTGRYRTALDRNVPNGNFISRADLADAILRHLEDSGSTKTTVGIGY